jgi:hypothetical protein
LGKLGTHISETNIFYGANKTVREQEELNHSSIHSVASGSRRLDTHTHTHTHVTGKDRTADDINDGQQRTSLAGQTCGSCCLKLLLASLSSAPAMVILRNSTKRQTNSKACGGLQVSGKSLPSDNADCYSPLCTN